jgi:hypothetical protein
MLSGIRLSVYIPLSKTTRCGVRATQNEGVRMPPSPAVDREPMTEIDGDG